MIVPGPLVATAIPNPREGPGAGSSDVCETLCHPVAGLVKIYAAPLSDRCPGAPMIMVDSPAETASDRPKSSSKLPSDAVSLAVSFWLVQTPFGLTNT